MRYGQALRDGQVASWQSSYCDYEKLKSLSKKCSNPSSTSSAPSPGGGGGGGSAADAAFIQALELELQKVKGFIHVQLAELRARVGVLRQQCDDLPRVPLDDEIPHSAATSPLTSPLTSPTPRGRDGSAAAGGVAVQIGDAGGVRLPPSIGADAAGGGGDDGSDADGDGGPAAVEGGVGAAFASKEARSSMRNAFVDVYRTTRMLESFVLLNSTAFTKAAKKFRKARHKRHERLEKMQDRLNARSPFSTSPLASPISRLRDSPLFSPRRLVARGNSPPPARAAAATSSSPSAALNTPLISLPRSSPAAPRSEELPAQPAAISPGGGAMSPRAGASSPVGDDGSPGGSPGVGVEEGLCSVEAEASSGFGLGASVVTQLVEEVESMFGRAFYGSRCPPSEARAHLLVRMHASSQASNWRGFLLGWRVGACMLLFIWLGWDLSVDQRLRPDTHCQKVTPGYSLWKDPAVHVYHFAGALLLLEWCWCALLIVFRTSQINASYLLELPRNGRTEAVAIADAAKHSMLFALNMLLFFKVHHSELINHEASALHVANRALPLLVVVGCAFVLVHPWSTKKQLWVLFGQVLTGFCRPVRFVHVFFADWLTSVVKVWATIAHVACYYGSGDGFEPCPQSNACEQSPFFNNAVLPFISTLPYLLRLLQCLRMYLDTHKRFPHLANGFKYCFALVIVVIGATHGSWKQLSPTGTSVITDLWIATYAISTAYTYSWDVFMDWGLYFKEGRPYVFACEKLRRDRRMVSTDSWLPYYAAVAADAFLRFLWTLTLAPSSMPFGSFVQARPPPDDCPNLSALPADPPSRAASRHRMGYPLRMRPAPPNRRTT